MQKMHISFIKDLKNAEFYELFVYLDLILDAKESKDNQLKQVLVELKTIAINWGYCAIQNLVIISQE